MGLLAIAGGIDVRAARQHETVEQVERLGGILEQLLVRGQHQHERAGALHGLDVAAREQHGLLVPHAPAGALERRTYAHDRPCHFRTR
jgi:hypothetical protein